MKQNPYELIGDVHDQLTESDTDYQILANYSTDPELWGYSKIWLFLSLLPAMITLRLSTELLSGWGQLYGIVAAVVLTGLALAVTRASPSSMDAQDYFGAIVSHFTHQNDMIHESDPDESELAPPVKSSIGRLRRHSVVKDLPVIGLETNPTQDLVSHAKPYRGEYAIQRDDGAFIGAIQLKPIPLRLESEAARKKVEHAVAKAIESSVDYDAQWYSPQRTADYEERRTAWNRRSQEFEEQAVLTATDGSSAVDAIHQQIKADIATERAAGINLWERVKRIREYYLLVAVDPGEVVLDRSAEEGGLGTIPGVGWLVEKNRLRDQAGEPEHVDAMLRKLHRRVEDLSTALRRVEGMSTVPLSAIDFSEQVADYYRPTDMHDINEFGASIRGAPVPVDDETAADVTEQEVTWKHITNSLGYDDEQVASRLMDNEADYIAPDPSSAPAEGETATTETMTETRTAPSAVNRDGGDDQ